jgi:hypothetical protein
MASYLRIGTVFLAAALSISLLAAPARAQSAEATLTEASKALEKGVPAKAIELIDAAMRAGKLPSDMAAKALLMRAQAQEKLGKQAFALADYNSALWMDGLSAADKAQAEQGRDRISGKLGIAQSAAKPAASGGRANAGEDTAARTPTSAQVKSTPSEQRTGGIGSVFNGIFGSSSEPAQEEPRPAAVEPAAAAKPAVAVRPAAAAKPTPAAKPVAALKPERAQPAKAKAEKPAEKIAVSERTSPTAATGDGSGKFGIQFAALHSEDGAISEVERIAKKYGSELAGRSPSVKILGTSDGGTLYKIVAEPYERGEATAICELLKTKNLNCMIVSR